jgi:uncharacterized repeat protein (TIGR03943 family)
MNLATASNPLLRPHLASKRNQQWAKAFVLLGLGVYFAYIISTGNLANYINERFAWLSYVALVGFFGLGAHGLYRALRASRGEAVSEHTTIGWTVLVILAIPLVFGTLPSRPLGVDAIDGGVSTVAADGVVNPSQLTTFTVAPQNRNILDWLRAYNAAEDPDSLNGEPADVIGFVYSEPEFGSETFMASRFTISCCVADSRAIGLPVQWAEASALAQGAWVRIVGTVQVGEFRGEQVPIIQATTVEIVEQPKHPYLYP